MTRSAILGAGLLAVTLLVVGAGTVVGQDGPGPAASDPISPSAASTRILSAVSLEGPEPVVDGRIDEAVWRDGAHATDFVQFRPDEGAPPSQDTEAWILYGSDALWVAIRAHDSSPEGIAGQLTRRDEHSYSDEVAVAVDSYFDRRTAFIFSVNPVGVRKDIYMFEDGREDESWDAVWDVASAVDGDGWTAEFRIPYSQLRFSGAPSQDWGINIMRRIARLDEQSFWSPISQQRSGLVSQFGVLEGLRELESPNRLEVEPYAMARVERAPGEAADPFHRSNDLFGALGADLEYGVTNNLTLNVSLNPDFGQVEADPGEVNLTAFETFFSEKRPFFLEGRSIFDFGLSGGNNQESLFYSRRIGRAPQGRPDTDGGYADTPASSTILGAAKLSGKTEGGWSVGLLNAVTAEEVARIETGSGDRLDEPVEPRSNYSVARIQKDFRDGFSAVGLMATATARDREVADALELHRGAFTGGLDLRHRFGEAGNYQVSGSLVGSRVTGSAATLEETQTSSVHYFQRPDADHVEVDPTRTALNGWGSTFNVSKIGGGFWRGTWFFESRSPGLETNDVGFQSRSDYWVTGGFVGYHVTEPGEHLRRWAVNANAITVRTLSGDRIELDGNLNGSLTFHNLWGVNMGVARTLGGLSTTDLRGGPAIRTDPGWNGWGGINSDSRKALSGRLGWNWSVTPESDSWSVSLNQNLEWRASSRASVRLQPFVRWTETGAQWVRRIELEGGSGGLGGRGTEYVFARLDQRTIGLTTRFEMSFTPDLSLQLYAQPFMSAGGYDEFKRVADPLARGFAERYAALSPVRVGDDYEIDLDGDGAPESFSDPDFNSLQFRSNAVLRWEYQPGSTLYLVWAQARDGDGIAGTPAFGDDLDDLFRVHPTNVLMLKVSYWLNP